MFWPFRRSTAPDPALVKASESLQDHERTLADLASRLEQVESLAATLDHIPIEWATMLDKLNRWASRQAARERKRASDTLDAIESPALPSTHDADPARMSKAELRRYAQARRMHVIGNQGG